MTEKLPPNLADILTQMAQHCELLLLVPFHSFLFLWSPYFIFRLVVILANIPSFFVLVHIDRNYMEVSYFTTIDVKECVDEHGQSNLAEKAKIECGFRK